MGELPISLVLPMSTFGDYEANMNVQLCGEDLLDGALRLSLDQPGIQSSTIQ